MPRRKRKSSKIFKTVSILGSLRMLDCARCSPKRCGRHAMKFHGFAASLMLVAKAIAATEDRDYLIPDDVKAAAHPVLRHRIILKPEADLEGVTADQVVREVVNAVEVPK